MRAKLFALCANHHVSKGWIPDIPASTPASTKASMSEYRDCRSLTANERRLPWNFVVGPPFALSLAQPS